MPLELKRKARRLVPPALRQLWADRADTRRADAEDLAGAFSAIYENGEWGAGDGFYSGPGSEDHNSQDFVDIANRLIAQEGLTSVVDIGCGDFRVGSRIARPELDYLGVDIFGPLIEQHQERHGRPGVEFRQLVPLRKLCPLPTSA